MEGTTEEARGWSQIVALAVLLPLTIFWLAVVFRRKASGPADHRSLPPGPRGWPVFGSLLSLGTLPHRSLQKLSTQYGPLMLVRFGCVPTLVVSSPEMAKEILKTHDRIMASRPDSMVANQIAYHQQDIGYAPLGEHWRYLRKICTKELFTVSRLSQYQGIRQEEALAMVQSILEESQEGKVTLQNVGGFFSNLANNNVTRMLMNKRYCVSQDGRSSSDEHTEFRENMREMIELLGAVNISDYIPALRPFDLQGLYKRANIVHVKADRHFTNIIDDHKKMQASIGMPVQANEDFVSLLLKLPKADDSDDPLSTTTIKAILQDMIVAGTQTSSTALEWALAELMRNPSVMRKTQDELKAVVGTERLVDEADISSLKYLQAVVKETFRVHPPVPLNVPHESTDDCEIAGFHIPAKCQVFINIWAIHQDPAVWERPSEFDPARHLNSAVDLKGQDFELIPFGSGRRMCPAMNLSLVMMQLALAQLIHAIDWTLPNDMKPHDLDMSERFGLSCPRAVPLNLVAKPRLAAHVIYSSFA